MYYFYFAISAKISLVLIAKSFFHQHWHSKNCLFTQFPFYAKIIYKKQPILTILIALPCHRESLSISAVSVCRKLSNKSFFSSAKVSCWNSAVNWSNMASLFSRNILTQTAIKKALLTVLSFFSRSVNLQKRSVVKCRWK